MLDLILLKVAFELVVTTGPLVLVCIDELRTVVGDYL